MDIRAHRERMPLPRGRRLAPRDLGSILRQTTPLPAAGTTRRLHRVETTTRGFERERELDRECGEVTGAILAVAGGRVSRIVLCNLRHSAVVTEALRGVAAKVAVELVLVDRPGSSGSDIAVRRR